jgi:hypothetical protein
VKKFQKFLQQYAPTLSFPLSEGDWLLYVAFLEVDEKLKPGSIGQYLTHLTKFFACVGLPQPLWKDMKKLRVLRTRIKGLQIAKGKKKQPVHFKLVKQIVDSADTTRADSNVFVAILIVGVVGLFRLGELLVTSKSDIRQERLLRVGHVAFYPTIDDPQHVSIFLPYSKCDKWGMGINIVLPANKDSQYCPVQRLLELVRGRDPTEPLFVWPAGVIITKSAFIKELRRNLLLLGIDYKLYSGHSLRRGGAMSAKASGASDELIRILGRWSSDSYKIYIKCVPTHILELNAMLAARELVQ